MMEGKGFALIPLCAMTPHDHLVKGVHTPCETPGKNPIRMGWETTAPGAYPADSLAQRATYGVVLTAEDIVVDVDPRNYKEGVNSYTRFIEKLGAPLPRTFAVLTGGGGYHLYYKKPAGFKVRNSLKEFPGVEFKAGPGRQMVGPGSAHALGGTYSVISASVIAQAPDILLALIEKVKPAAADLKGTGEYKDDAATRLRFTGYLSTSAPTSGSFLVAARGRDFGLPPQVTLELMLHHWNPRRTAPKTREDMSVKVAHAYQYASGEVGASHPAAAFTAVEAPPAATNGNGNGSHQGDLTWNRTPQGALLRTFNNLVNFLRDPQYGLAAAVAYNEFTGRNEFVKPAPWHRGKLPRFPGVGDDDLKLLKGYLSSRCAFEAPVTVIEEALTNAAYNNRFHPVREYLEALKWDGKARLDTWLHDFLGVEDTPYSRACARKVLCAAVSRVFNPGCKFDHVLVLEGMQDVGKSTAIEILGGKWAADAAVDPHSRDTVQMMQGRWIIELAEMEVIRRVEEEALRAFLTRKTDLARLAYGRTTGEFPRQSIFIATKNPRDDGTYLKDEENRRWWPVRCAPSHGAVGSQVDFAGLKAARDQLFAEAVVVVRTKEEKLFMETAALKQEAKVEVGKRRVEHSWTERVSSWISEVNSQPETRRDFVTAYEVFIEAMGGQARLFDRRATTSIASVMRGLGWENGYRRRGKDLVRGYQLCDEKDSAKSVLGDLL